ncbi:phosphatidylinositol 3-kinase catalytic subunit type 3 isoform X5 [Amazona aestiva]|uniref:Phosphatidylinositol 3-kinase catalytic subunit type 3 n=1 Tax=Amazona aestiva TaxID=12930 RepID=A0A0Q3TE42_AMAAE|nr:phosphatidylinositol 3-kinase catalytic subunit type 3 isoform X5 [Amazona aestiva]
MGEAEKFYYVYSCDLDINVQLKISTCHLVVALCKVLRLILSEYLQVVQDKVMSIEKTDRLFLCSWNEWLKLPVKYPDLPRNAQVALTIWDVYGPGKAVPVGGTTVSLFGKYGMFRQGMHDLKVWPNVEADGSEPTKTPGRTSSTVSEDQMSRLAKLTKSHRQGHMVKVDWLDRLTFREIEMINEREKRSSNFMYLMIEFRCVKCDDKEYGIVYYEKDGDESSPILTNSEIVKIPDPQMSMTVPKYSSRKDFHYCGCQFSGTGIGSFGNLNENLVESKHHKLARSLRSGPSDHDLKPNAATRDQLNIIVSYPPTKQLTYEEQDLVWKFRYYLTNQEKALTKFLKCVNWDLPQEAKQALELLGKWKPMDVEDSLELLSSHFSNPTVRRYAVARLQQADDELVQALKYENFDDIKNGLEPSKRDSQGSVSESMTTSGTNGAEIDSSQIMSPVPPVSSPPLTSKTKELADNENLDGDKSVRVMRSLLAAQQTFVDRLVHVMKAVQRESGNRKKKNERLQALLADNEKMNLADMELIPLPLEPQVKIKGIIPEKATLFKNFFRKHAPSDTGPHGISAEVMDTYVKSCGKLFHIDFGYILGRDPKPLPPPMKLNKEMVEGMGGTQSEQYQEFRKQCYTAFLHLRRYSNLILNLFSLMVDANIPDIALEPDKTVKKVQDKFRLDLSDEEAVHYMQSLIDESVHALFAAVVEQIHKFAQLKNKTALGLLQHTRLVRGQKEANLQKGKCSIHKLQCTESDVRGGLSLCGNSGVLWDQFFHGRAIQFAPARSAHSDRVRTGACMARKLFKGVIQLRSLTTICQGSTTLEAISFPRKSTATDVGIMDEVFLKVECMAKSWLP